MVSGYRGGCLSSNLFQNKKKYFNIKQFFFYKMHFFFEILFIVVLAVGSCTGMLNIYIYVIKRILFSCIFNGDLLWVEILCYKIFFGLYFFHAVAGAGCWLFVDIYFVSRILKRILFAAVAVCTANNRK